MLHCNICQHCNGEDMKICQVDDRGRVLLKKLVMNLPEYYSLEENVKGQLVLTPLCGTDSMKAREEDDSRQ